MTYSEVMRKYVLLDSGAGGQILNGTGISIQGMTSGWGEVLSCLLYTSLHDFDRIIDIVHRKHRHIRVSIYEIIEFPCSHQKAGYVFSGIRLF